MDLQQPAAGVLTLRERFGRLREQGAFLAAQALLPEVDASDDLDLQLDAANARWHLGARRVSEARVLRLWRANPDSTHARIDAVRTITQRQGLYRGWKCMRSLPAPAAGDPLRPEWLSLQALMMAALRDAEQARAYWSEAVALAPQEPWLHIEWASACEALDEFDEAMASARRALELRPGMRSAIDSMAHLLMLTGREAEALDMLERGAAASESASLAISLLDLQIELRQFEPARKTLVVCRERLPLADANLRKWMDARALDIELALGNRAAARTHAMALDGPFFAGLAQRLAQPEVPDGRVELPVGFVRQHFNTCAPATLSALSAYWGKAAPHVEVAEAICYDGTPAHSERRWAQEQGFHVREFTVDWAVACALLDAGVPFTLTTVGTGSAHLQAVIGYDALRQSLLIRDPSKRTYNEFDADALWETHRAVGPRGMVLLPAEEAGRLQGIPLPECELWDDYYAVQSGLSRHDRPSAMAAVGRIERAAPGHRLAIMARMAVASYDGNDAETLAQTERLLALFPHETNFKLAKARAVSNVQGRAAAEAWWQELSPVAQLDPAVAVAFAYFLSVDGRNQQRTWKLLDRALWRNSHDGAGWSLLATVHWERDGRELAVAHYRIAACVEPTNEFLAQNHARACALTGRMEEGVNFLRARFARLGSRSAQPAITLFERLESLERTPEGFEVLEEALRLRPDDPALLLFAAEACLRTARHEQGSDLLQRAKPIAKLSDWLRLRALYLREQRDFAGALETARQACTLEPLNVSLQRLVAGLLEQTAGGQAAIEYLRSVAARHEHHFELQRLLLAWLPQDDLGAQVTQLRHMLAVNPLDAWAHREIAVKLARQLDYAPALEHAQRAMEIAPEHSECHGTLAFVLLRQGRNDEARSHLERALRISVDNDYAASVLVETSNTPEQRQQALALLRSEFVRQPGLGDGLLKYQELARGILDDADVLQQLRDLHAARQDQWQSWVALAAQLKRSEQFDEAMSLLTQATKRYPFLPRVYLELAHLQSVTGRREEARTTLQRALQLSPAWAAAVRLYVETIVDERTGWERALGVLEPALQRVVDSADLRALRGWVLRQMGRTDEALTDLRASLALDPGSRWTWETLRDFARQMDRATLVSEVAEELVRARPGDPVAWLRLAEFARDAKRASEAVEQGLRLDARHVGLQDEHARQLMVRGELDALEQALARTPWGEDLPPVLQAWRARVARARGQTDRAFEVMRAILERDPTQHALWSELATWQNEAGRVAGYLESARQIVRLAPLAAMSHGYLGHALMRSRQDPQAVDALWRALELDPNYQFAALMLADIELDGDVKSRAAEALDLAERSGPTPATDLRRTRLAARQGDREGAVRYAARVTASREAGKEVCEQALRAVIRVGGEPWLLDKLEEQIAAGWCAEAGVIFWLEHQGGGVLPGSLWRDIAAMMARDPGRVLQRGVLAWLAQRPKSQPLLRKFLRRYRHLLRADIDSLALGGYALLGQNLDRECVQWLSDWRDHPGMPGWALDNLAIALHRIGQHAEAAHVAARSAELDPGNMQARVWLAYDAALNDRVDELVEWLGRIEVEPLRMYWRHLVSLMRAYADAARANDSRVALPRLAALEVTEPSLRLLLRKVTYRLVVRHTPAWVRPWRALQFTLGWS